MPTPAQISPDETFSLIRRAQADGRRIVPLLGSGISVDAGIPTSSFLADYITVLYGVIKKQGMRPYDYLQQNRWPHRHDTWDDWHATLEDKGYDSLKSAFSLLRAELCRLCISFELRPSSPLYAQLVELGDAKLKVLTSSLTVYRSFLTYVTENDAHLIDAFFDHFVRDRVPAGAHQLTAFLARLLRMNLILTTNFDPLIEDALRNEGFHPTVYEIGQHTELPGPLLVQSQPISIIKLHGGTHALRTGFDLDDPLPIQALQQIREYLRNRHAHMSLDGGPCLLLVLGYSGSDRRVMDIVNDHAKSWHEFGSAHDRPNVVWIAREEQPPDQLKFVSGERNGNYGAVQFCQYKNGHLFLQELYQVLANQFPVSRTQYRTSLPAPRVPSEEARLIYNGRVEEYDAASRYLLVWGQDEGCGTSTVLHQFVEKNFASSHEIIWIDACDIQTRAEFLSQLEDEFIRLDRGNVRMSRPLFLQDVDYLDTVWESDAPSLAGGIPLEDTDIEMRLAVRWVKRAMRRGNYVIAVDSLGEFAHVHPAIPNELTPSDSVFSERIKILQFLGQLCLASSEFGRSVFISALTPMFVDCNRDAPSLDQQIFLATAGSHSGAKLYPTDCPGKSNSDSYKFKHRASQRAKWTAGVVQVLLQRPRNALQLAVGLLVVIASFFRRPRSRTALRVALLRYLDLLISESDTISNATVGLLREIQYGLSIDDQSVIVHRKPSYFDSILSACIKSPYEWPDEFEKLDSGIPSSHDEGRSLWALLSHLEGGYYWMHLCSRDRIYNEFACTKEGAKASKWFSPLRCAQVYDRIARFAHDDVYERSRDLSAFIEYVFYRFQSIELFGQLAHDNGGKYAAIWSDHLQWLCGAIEGAKDKLLASNKLIPLIGQLRIVIRYLILLDAEPERLRFRDTTVQEMRERQRFVATIASRLFGVQAALLLSSGRSKHALGYKLWQARTHIEMARCRDGILMAASKKLEVSIRNMHGSYYDFLKRVEVELGDTYDTLLDWRSRLEDIHGKAVPNADAIPEIAIPRASGAINQEEAISAITIGGEIARLATTAFLLPENTRMQTDWPFPLMSPNFCKLRRRIKRACAKILLISLKVCKELDERRGVNSVTPTRMTIEEATAFTIVRLNHLRINDCLANDRFAWIFGEKCDPPADPKLARRKLRQIIKESEFALERLRMGTSTANSSRIESYLYTLRGAAIAHLQDDDQKARVSFLRAQSVLERPEAPSDHAAIALALLVQAEALLTRFRFVAGEYTRKEMIRDDHWTIIADLGSRSRTMPNEAPPEIRSRLLGLLDGAKQVLEQARQALDAGCSENKWRMFSFYLCACRDFLHYKLLQSDRTAAADVEAQRESLRSAFRYAVGGLTICGRYSDRRPIMRRLVKRIEINGRALFGDEEWRRERRRSGIGSRPQYPSSDQGHVESDVAWDSPIPISESLSEEQSDSETSNTESQVGDFDIANSRHDIFSRDSAATGTRAVESAKREVSRNKTLRTQGARARQWATRIRRRLRMSWELVRRFFNHWDDTPTSTDSGLDTLENPSSDDPGSEIPKSVAEALSQATSPHVPQQDIAQGEKD